MSADNGVYILVTKDTHKKTSPYCWTNTFGEGVVAYRVAHAQAIDNIGWYEKNEPYNVGAYLHSIFGNSEPIYDKDEALKQANKIWEEISFVEHGISFVERLQYNFFW